MLKVKPSPLQSYSTVVLTVSTALLIRGSLSPLTGQIDPFLLFAPAVMVSAYLGGLGPGLLATVLSALAAGYFFVSPANNFAIDSPADVVHMALFVLVGLFMSWLCASEKKSQDALQESEERYRDLVENSQTLICTHDLDGVILSVNEGAAKMLGYGPHLLLKKNVRDILTPEFRQEFDTYLAAIRTDGFATGLMHVETSSGETRVWEYRNTVRTHGVKSPFVRGAAHDVTAHRRAEEALRETTYTLQALIRASPLAVVELDGKGAVKLWNPAAERIFGWGEQEVIGRPLAIVPDDKQQESAANLQTVLNGRWVIGLETRREKKGGTIIDVSLSLAPVRDAKGSVSGVVGIIDDITERKQVERALKQSERDYRGLFENAHDAILIFDPDREVVLEVNQRACDLYGFGREEFVGLSMSDISRDPEGGRVRVRETLGSEPYHHFESVQYRKDGTEMYLEVNASKVGYKGRTAILSINRDVTGRRLAERERERLLASERAARGEAEEASRAKDEFLATVSHELRTPLTSILGWTQILRKGKFDGDMAALGLEVIERNSRAQVQLIEDLLDVSRLVSGKLHLEMGPTSLLSVITAAVEVVRPAAEAKQIELRMQADASIGQVQGDPGRLQQVVWNLLTNAVKFTGEGSQVEVRLERIRGHAQITVSDTGQGISADFLPYVFDRFRQADSSLTRRHGGLGLGLAIVRQLVEMHGGTVRAESGGEGRGASFTVRLPLREGRSIGRPLVDEVGHRASSAGHSHLSGGHPFVEGLRVLVVDDDAGTREMLLEMLGQNGAEVTACSSAAEALELLHRARPDVLVSDIAMPGEDGYALIRKVRGLRPEQGGRTPAVALTAHAKAEDRQRALSAGYEVFVPKPVEADELLGAIAGLARPSGPYH
jgi:PAS domain S-box-containing protein